MAAPLLATISATSPRQAMPRPTCRLSLQSKPHTLAPRPQPTSFERMAVSTSSRANTPICQVMEGSDTFSPMLAKNTGVSSRYDNGWNFESMYAPRGVLAMMTPAAKAPMMSATPNTRSAM